MNKASLKKFATEARIELLKKIELQARKLGISAESIHEANVESSDAVFIDGKQLSDIERKQRNKLIARINEIGFNQVIEETAYTWFNRFIALRYMEVNDYLPTKVRVLSSTTGSSEPDMMREALSLNLDIDKEKVYEMKMNNQTDELFKYLIKVHCNDLNRYMPFMFETIEDYTEILFPEGLLGIDSFVRRMTDTKVIPEDDWKNVEIIGWLYQYYISDEKDRVFANLKKNIKISKDTLPAATQLFTPNWIVRYMVENSLGRIWLESYPESQLKNEWKYYLDESKQEDEVIKQLEEIRYKNVNPEEITFIDPCCGSGHILVYAFDVFYEFYLEKGYMESEIPKLILEKNLYGLDIDERAAQLASFAVMMKAREKSRRVFRQSIQLNIYAIQESNWMANDIIEKLSDNNSLIKENLNIIRDTFTDAKEYGSLLQVEPIQYNLILQRLKEYMEEKVDLFELIDKQTIEEKLPSLLMQTKILSNKYDVVCTNPPYMGSGNMSSTLSKYIKKKFPNSKSDLFAVFIEKCINLTKKNGFSGMITMHSWMFLSSFSKLRKLLLEKNFINLIHIGFNSFPEMNSKVAQAVSFVQRNSLIREYQAKYLDLTNKYPQSFNKNEAFTIEKQNNHYYLRTNDDFKTLPEYPIAYWMPPGLKRSFSIGKPLSEIGTTRLGMTTGDNSQFTKFWFEVDKNKLILNAKDSKEVLAANAKWVPYNKGGKYRKWYGNNDVVVNWENDGWQIKNFKDDNGRIRSTVPNTEYYFKKCLSWSKVSSKEIAFRFKDNGFIFDVAGASLFVEEDNIMYLLGFLNSKISSTILSILSPTLNYEGRHISNLPIILSTKYKTRVEELVENSISISKSDWDSFEDSWDFKQHPFLIHQNELSRIEKAYDRWSSYTISNFNQLKKNEEELNRIFIDIYDLKEEINQDVDEENVTVRKSDLERDIKSFISYAIGCSFGRYSLDEEGLIYAGGEFVPSRYQTFPVDRDNILPILSESYFEDDIVTRFVDFVRITFGEDTLEENLNFVANVIGRKNNETSRESLRRYFLNDFYKDHLKVYKKRPIYWLFSSGKEKAFNCLIYMHRYDKSTLSRIRTDYLHEVQTRMEAEKNDLVEIINGEYTTREINRAKRELKSLDKKIDELKKYDELLHHMADMQIEIDLDDGVKVNYDKFKGLVAKI